MRYPDFSKDEVDKCVEMLSSEEKNLLFLKFGSNANVSRLTDLEKKRVSYIVNVKLKRFLAAIKDPNKKFLESRRKLVSIYDAFKGYTKNQIDEVINSLTADEKKLLRLRYGDNLEKPVKNIGMSDKEKEQFNYLLFVTISNKLRKHSKLRSYIDDFEKAAINKANSNQLRILIGLIHSSTYSELLEKCSMQEVMVLFLFFEGLNGIRFSAKMISDFLNLDISDVKNILETYLIDMKSNLKSDNGYQLVNKKK